MTKKMPTMAKIGIIFLTGRRQLQRKIAPMKITLKQYYLLRQLTKQEYLNPSQVADMLFCDRPTATVIIKNLERQNWIRREKDPENGKQIRLYLTDEGRKKYEQTEEFIYGQEENDPLDCLTLKEKELLDRLITKVYLHLRQ